MQILRTKTAGVVLGFGLALAAAGGLAACGSSGSKNSPVNPISNTNPAVTQPAATTPSTAAPSGGGVSY